MMFNLGIFFVFVVVPGVGAKEPDVNFEVFWQ